MGINCIGFTCDDVANTAKAITAAGGVLNEVTSNYTLAGDIQNGRILLR